MAGTIGPMTGDGNTPVGERVGTLFMGDNAVRNFINTVSDTGYTRDGDGAETKVALTSVSGGKVQAAQISLADTTDQVINEMGNIASKAKIENKDLAKLNTYQTTVTMNTNAIKSVRDALKGSLQVL